MTKKIKLFGLLTIEEDGQPAAVMKSSKGCALLVYLLITQKTYSREALADMLWEANSTKESLRNLRQLLVRVKKLLPELEIERRQIGLRPDLNITVDLHQFKDQISSRHVDQQAAALRLYDGELLSGFYLNDAPRFEEWLMIERERIHRQVVTQYQQLCVAYTDQEAWAKGAAAARHWIELDELNEAAHRFLMRFLAAEGQLPAALAQYQSLCQLLEAELGVEPEQETAALYEQITAAAHQLNEEVNQQAIRAYHHHWGEAPGTAAFFGRQAELDTLTQWLVYEHAHVVTILGIGGQGKTSLAALAARSLADQFDGVYWRSVINAPPLKLVLPDYLNYLSQNQVIPPETLAEQLVVLQEYLRNGRYLLVLDNLETILESEEVGRFREGYEEYEQILQLFGGEGHQSCLLITSREAPALLSRLMQQSDRIHELLLSGLDDQAGLNILEAEQINISAEASAALTKKYSGNPLVLKLAAQSIQEFYFGDVQAFLGEESLIFDDVSGVLNQQFQRLSPLEREILLWLAVMREAATPQTLSTLLLRPVRQRHLLESMRHLQRRSLLERERHGFTLQNVVTEFLTDHLVNQVCREIVTGRLSLLEKHPLMLAQTKEYIRQSQVRVILEPVGKQLLTALGSKEAVGEKMKAHLDGLRQKPAEKSYAAGNLLNLLLHMAVDVTGYDFSRLSIRQAYLQGSIVQAASFVGADLSNTVFMDTFAAVYGLAYSPDGTLLASGASSSDVRLWNVSEGRLVRILDGHEDTIMAVAFNPTGDLLASCGRDQVIHLWQSPDGYLARTLKTMSKTVWSIAFSPDGETLASVGDDGRVYLWDVGSGELRHYLEGHTGLIRTVAFSPNGKLLASGGDDCGIRLWDVESSGEVRFRTVLEAHRKWIRDLAFSPNGRILASGGGEKFIHLWDVESEQLCATLKGHTDAVRALAFSPDGQTLASASDDKTIRVWNAAKSQFTGHELPLHILRGHDDWAVSVAYHPTSQVLATGSNDQSIRFWNIGSGQLERSFHGYANWITSIARAPNSPLLAIGTHDRAAHLWNIETRQIHKTLEGHTERVMVAASPDGGMVATYSTDQTIRLWDAPSGDLLLIINRHNNWIAAAAFSPDGRTLASGGAGQTIYLWDTSTGECRSRLPGHTGNIQSLAFSPDGQMLASGSQDKTVAVWDISSATVTRPAKIVHTLLGHTNWVDAVAFSPNSQTLATGSTDLTIRLWDVRTGEGLSILSGHTGWIRDLAFSPNGQTLASSSLDQTVRLWRLADSKSLCLDRHDTPVYGVIFTEDGDTVISGSSSGMIQEWDVSTGERLAVWRLPRPYEGTNIRGVSGITNAQRASLLALGAVDDNMAGLS